MSCWASRRDARGASSFIKYTPETVELLVPPGTELAGQPAVRFPLRMGLWTWAQWPRNEDTLVDFDEPLTCERLRTVAVLTCVGDCLRGDVADIMQQQVNYAWTLCDPHPAGLVEDRRALRHAALLMQLTSEIGEAFPGEGLGRVEEPPVAEMPDHYETFLRMLPGGSDEPEVAAGARSFSTWDVVFALARVLFARVRGRRRMTVTDIGDYMRPARTDSENPPASGPNERPNPLISRA